MAMEVVMPARTLQPGTYTSASKSIVLETTPGCWVTARAIMNQADIDDPAVSLRFAVECTFDAEGLNWISLCSKGWRGGYPIKPGYTRVGPIIRWQSGDYPMHIRGVLDLPQRLNIGVELGTEI